MATQDDSRKSWENDDAKPTQPPANGEQQPGAVESPDAETTEDGTKHLPTVQDETLAAAETVEATQPALGPAQASTKRGRGVKQAKMAAGLHRIRLTGAATDETVPAAAASVATDPTTEPEVAAPAGKSGKRQRKAKKDRLQDWDKWSRFRLWRRTRPLWGSIFMMLSSIILLALPLSLLQFAAFLPESFGVSLLVGGLLFIMALAQLIVPSYSLLTGSIGILLSLVSLVTSTFGGLFIGMLLGIVGGALSLAWRPIKRARLVATKSSN